MPPFYPLKSGLHKDSWEAALGMLRLDFAYARLSDSIGGGAPVEMVRLAQHRNLTTPPQEIGQALNPWLAGDQGTSPLVVRNLIGEGDVSIARLRLGLQDEVGVLVVGSQRADFPTETERLLLGVAANQAAIGLQEARLLSEHRRAAEQVEQQVVERTRQLAAVNEELRERVIERKRAENALRRSESYLAEAQKLSHTGSFGWNPSTGDLIWSEESFRIFQYAPTTKPTVERILQRVHPEDVALVKQAIERASLDGKDYEHAYRLLMPDGSMKHVHVVARAVRDESDSLEFVGALMDITARKQGEEALRTAQAELAHVTRVKTLGELTSSIAHEVNQPLAAIVTNGNACLRWLAAQPPNLEEACQAVGRIIKDGHRASEVIGRIRALVKKTPPQKEWLDLNEILREVIALARSEVQRHRVLLQTQLSEDLPLVRGDRIQLQQVILNLVMNGIEAMSGVNERPRELLVRSSKDGVNGVLVAVGDSGIGLDEEMLAHLFDPFYTTKPTGLGMGLVISRSIIEAHGGRLWAEANTPPGAAFQFTLPVEEERVS